MKAKLLDGKLVAEAIKKQLISRIKQPLVLAVFLIGDDPASRVYVSHKQKACREVGIETILHEFPNNTSLEEVLHWINWANNEPTVAGILVQLPLPDGLDTNFILNRINPLKDVDCFNPANQGLLMSGVPRFKPCTPAGIVELFKHYDIDTKGKHVCIINNTIVVGQPLATMLSQEGKATVTMCHEHTRNILVDGKSKHPSYLADIVITAVGKPNFRLTGDMVSKGAVVVDVGIYREGKKIRGDAVFEEVSEKASWITPVPGGVGPMTIAMLLSNTVQAMEAS